MGVHITFVRYEFIPLILTLLNNRSLKMDRWKPKELKCMELGGNKNAMGYYEKNGMYQADGTPNHKAPQLAKYKQDLAVRAE